MRLSVLTLNLWNVNEPLAARFAALAGGIEQLRPDIVCLQEVAHDLQSGRRQSDLVAQMCGLPHVLDHHALSILSRTPIVHSHSAALPEAPRDEPRQVLLAETSVEGRPLLIANTHLAWRPEMIVERKAQADALLAALARFASAGAPNAKILCGDFNDDPDSPAVRLVTAAAADFTMSLPIATPAIPVSPGRCKTLTSIKRRTAASASTTSLPKATCGRGIAPSCLTATASTLHRIISACSAISNFAEG